MCYLCGDAGAETQTSRKCCSEDKATDFEATDDFHDESFPVFSTKGGTARLSKSNTSALRVDQGFVLSRARNAGCLSGRPPRCLQGKGLLLFLHRGRPEAFRPPPEA